AAGPGSPRRAERPRAAAAAAASPRPRGDDLLGGGPGLRELPHAAGRREPCQVHGPDRGRQGACQGELAIAQLKKRTAEIIQQRRTCSQLAKWHQLAKGNSKAIASTYVYKPNFAFNASRAAIVHHWGGGGGGSHYHSAGTKLFNKGFRLRGVVMRHSHQAALRNGKAGQQRCDNRKGGAGGHGGRQARGPAGGRC
ncbi:unnamed protein product, partial [Prorocentrum cordatum]